MPNKQLPDQVSSPLALQALQRAEKNLGYVAATPFTRPAFTHQVDRNFSGKIQIRGSVELFDALDSIGQDQGRSSNAEVVAGVLEALSLNKRTAMMLKVLKAHLGDEVASQVLAEVPVFDLAACKQPKKFTVRLPPSTYMSIRDGLVNAIAAKEAGVISMNTWLLRALESWINLQRQHTALLNTAIAMDQARLG